MSSNPLSLNSPSDPDRPDSPDVPESTQVEVYLEPTEDATQAMVRSVDFDPAGSGFVVVGILLADGLVRSVRADAGWAAENELQPGDIAWVRPVGLYSPS
ncbi:hypothetical protein D1871_10340 [Nakamurella silvestris]|nr:hypothetical protein D1871_10340 [Nakamurella silvestris]